MAMGFVSIDWSVSLDNWSEVICQPIYTVGGNYILLDARIGVLVMMLDHAGCDVKPCWCFKVVLCCRCQNRDLSEKLASLGKGATA